MFREMLRIKQALPQEECIRLLTELKRGVLSLNGDDGYPYGMPMNHFYCPEDGKLYFHSALRGHKVDAMEKCAKASFCVYDEGYLNEGDWALNIKSVIVFGKIEKVEHERAMEVCRLLSRKFTSDEGYIDWEIDRSGAKTLCFALVPEHISGKLVNEK